VTSVLPEQTATLRELSELWRDTPFVLIGANALALQIDFEWRQTNDLDLVLSVALEDYPAGLAALPGWRPSRRACSAPADRKLTRPPADHTPACCAAVQIASMAALSVTSISYSEWSGLDPMNTFSFR